MNSTSLLHRYTSMLRREFHGYNAKSLLADFAAGITVGAVALPLALAFGAASVSPEYAAIGIAAGLITAVFAGIICGIFGGGSFQISGPTGAMAVVLGTVVSGKYGLTGMFLAGSIAGLLLLLCGIVRAGKLIRFIPKSVITGFTSGIAIIIALGQLGNFFGIQTVGESAITRLMYFFAHQLGEIRPLTVLCSVAVMLVMLVYPKKAAKFVPGSLIAILLLTTIAAIAKLDIATIGSIPRTLVNAERLQLSAVNGEMLRAVAPTAVTIALLGLVESLLCGACAANMKKEPFDSDVELIGQGLSNLILPFFGGVPSTAALARTSVAVKSGGKTRLTAVFHSLFLIACVFVLSGAIGYVPYAALAGVLVMTAVRMNDFAEIREYFGKKEWENIFLFTVTMVATVLLDLTYAIVIGVSLYYILKLCKKLCRKEN